MEVFDVAVIGGGVLGCFAARNLCRWELHTVLIEAAEDVCTGITKANTGIVYSGCDQMPGSLKARMTVEANGNFETLCRELEVPFSRCGSLMAAFGPRGDQALGKKWEQGRKNGVPGPWLLSGREALELEPMLSPAVTSALYVPSTGTVNPWQLGIAAWENAVQNGCETRLNTRVLSMKRTGASYLLETDRGEICCRAVINCAGLAADRVQELLFPPSVRIFPDAADYLVFDRHAPAPGHIVFQEPEHDKKGITAVPTADGNLLLGPTRRPASGSFSATDKSALNALREEAVRVLPELDFGQVIRNFAAVRPHPHRVVWKNGEYVPDGSSLRDFVIEHPAPGFYSLIGVKTPGLTCADGLGRVLAEQCAAWLEARPAANFNPHRSVIPKQKNDPAFRDIVCRCEQISRGEILEAIRRGATTVEGVKHRVGTGMGLCQGSRCTLEIRRILGEVSHGNI